MSCVLAKRTPTLLQKCLVLLKAVLWSWRLIALSSQSCELEALINAREAFHSVWMVLDLWTTELKHVVALFLLYIR